VEITGKIWVVCVDGSEDSDAALAHVMASMNRKRDGLVLLHVVKSGWFSDPQTLKQEADQTVLCKYERELKNLKPPIRWSSVLEVAYDIRAEMCKQVKELKGDYLVVGQKEQTRGRAMQWAPCRIIA